MGAVVDLRTALLAMSDDDRLALVQAVDVAPIQQPIAFLVSPWTTRYRDTYTRVMGRRGLDRRFFENEAEALRWLETHPGRPAAAT